ncbi:MAG: STAS domain-containing protein [Treponema sp.]|jgi:anti-anti-sigma factor|nr:STAS domain-containing protein [Treponema sp.]
MSNHEIASDCNEELRITLQAAPRNVNCFVIVLSGNINTHNSSCFHDEIATLIDAGYTRLLFHCRALAHVSSAGIGSFAALLKAVKTRGGDMALVELVPEVHDVFKLLGFGGAFPIKESLSEGFALFQNGAYKIGQVFRAALTCPVCSAGLGADKAGRFRCETCKAVITLDQWGLVFLG